jgi:hypothetical protein
LIHERHYSLGQASAARTWVSERLASMREALERLGDEDARVALERLESSDAGGSYPGRPVAKALIDFQAALSELEQMEIVVRDVERGLVDFPALREGEEVYLCWLEEEAEIGYWHRPDAGFAGRQAL